MLRIELFKGDITGVEADALVNAANNYLWMGSGVAGALKRVGGNEIEIEAMAKGLISVGDVVATAPGKLNTKYIIHAAVMGQDLQTDAEKIETATCNCLAKADELSLKSIAFPAFGTGVGGFSLEDCASIMIKTARQYQTTNALKTIIFVLYDQLSYTIFKNELYRQIK